MNEDRRKNGGLTNAQFDSLKEKIIEELTPILEKRLTPLIEAALWNSITQAVGQSVLRKGLWFGGAVFSAILAWLHGAGKLPFSGGE
jgi:hypothetical protein